MSEFKSLSMIKDGSMKEDWLEENQILQRNYTSMPQIHHRDKSRMQCVLHVDV